MDRQARFLLLEEVRHSGRFLQRKYSDRLLAAPQIRKDLFMRFTNKIPFVIAFFLLTVPLFARTYSTTFPATENPISEGGNWTSGSAAGTCGGSLCYYNFRTTQGFAFGTMPVGVGARDSTAILTGSWGRNQTITATAHWTNFTAGELELRPPSSLVAGVY